MIGTVIEAAETAECFLIGITYDSDTNHQFIDHVLVGIQPKVKEAREKGITFFFQAPFCRRSPGWLPVRGAHGCSRSSGWRSGALLRRERHCSQHQVRDTSNLHDEHSPAPW